MNATEARNPSRAFTPPSILTSVHPDESSMSLLHNAIGENPPYDATLRRPTTPPTSTGPHLAHCSNICSSTKQNLSGLQPSIRQSEVQKRELTRST